MKRRLLCAVLALALALGFALPAAAAAQGPAAVGQARDGGSYTLYYRSDLSMEDLPHTYQYSDAYFDGPATEYDHRLAQASLGLALAAFNTQESDSRVWLDGSQGREDSIRAAYQLLGFANPRFYHYDRSPNEYEDESVGFSFAQKTLTDGDAARTIVAVAVRGGGYGAEWAGNMNAGAGQGHEGLIAPVEEVYTALSAYLEQAARTAPLGEVKLWVTGFSRGGAVANLLAARVADGLPGIDPENTYVYTFAAPAAITASAPAWLQKDYDYNHTADGQLKPGWEPTNIHNILASADLVPRVMPEAWGYHRNGSDRYLPAVQQAEELDALDALAGAWPGSRRLQASRLASSETTDAIVQRLLELAGSQALYRENYQNALMDMLQCAFTLSEDEVRLGVVLGNEAVIRRMRSLRNMQQEPVLELVRYVWLANGMVKPLLERLGDELPLRAQQLAGPLLAVGLYYGLDGEGLQALARYIIEMAVVRGQGGQIMGVAVWHFPEAYLAAMEFYPPSAHTMQPHTRR